MAFDQGDVLLRNPECSFIADPRLVVGHDAEQNLTGIKWFRTIFYLPVVVPSIATLTLWQFIYEPQYGLANSLLREFGLPPGTWLTSETTALPSIVLIGLWQVGSSVIIFLSGLQSVPQEMYEAAEVDGASRWRMSLNITHDHSDPVPATYPRHHRRIPGV